MKRIVLPTITDCSDCGACCTGQAALPIHLVNDNVSLESVTPLPPELAAELRAETERFLRDGFPPDGSPCIWYDAETKRCKHYEYRPVICRDEVQPGDDSCRRWRRSVGVNTQRRFVIQGGRLKQVVRE